MKPFTIILPIKGTDEEFKFMEKWERTKLYIL